MDKTLFNDLMVEINEILALHGGSVEVDRVEGGKVYVHLEGGCKGCKGAKQTLKMGMLGYLQQHIPEIEEIVDLTDHASGENPYIK